MSERVDRALVLEALRKALVQRPGVRDLVHHSDRGSQYASHDYRDCSAPGSLDTRLSYAAWRSSCSSRDSIGV
jgi:transposase InsO family protein